MLKRLITSERMTLMIYIVSLSLCRALFRLGLLSMGVQRKQCQGTTIKKY